MHSLKQRWWTFYCHVFKKPIDYPINSYCTHFLSLNVSTINCIIVSKATLTACKKYLFNYLRNFLYSWILRGRVKMPQHSSSNCYRSYLFIFCSLSIGVHLKFMIAPRRDVSFHLCVPSAYLCLNTYWVGPVMLMQKPSRGLPAFCIHASCKYGTNYVLSIENGHVAANSITERIALDDGVGLCQL